MFFSNVLPLKGSIQVILFCGLLPFTLGILKGRSSIERKPIPARIRTPVFPAYNPIDMEQFKPVKVFNEMERAIPVPIQEALKIVRRQKMQACVALIICTLACDPKSQGPNGDEAAKQLSHLSRLSNDSSIHLTEKQMKDINLFKEAETKGTSHRGHCDLCKDDYPKCKKQISELLNFFVTFNILD